MLENLAYEMIKARQQTTTDGSWLLRADVGARRMGVQAHRVMMTWLMHEVLSTANLTPTRWDDFNREYSLAKVFPSQNIVRASTDERFTCFSWSTGLKSYTGYIAPHINPNSLLPATIPDGSPSGKATTPVGSPSGKATVPDRSPSGKATTPDGSPSGSNLIVPFRAHNTGNFLGWYEVEGRKTDAVPVVSGIYDLHEDSYVMNGELNTNESTLNNRFAIYSTPGNAVIYLDYVRANADVTINKEKGGLMAISVDELTNTKRTFCFEEGDSTGSMLLDGSTFTTMTTNWINVNNSLSIVSVSNKQMAFGEKANNNSVMTAKLYASYSDKDRSVKAGDVVDQRNVTYYTNSDNAQAKGMADGATLLATPEGWNGIIMPDNNGYGADGAIHYMLLSNFAGSNKCTLRGVTVKGLGCPVFNVPTTITAGGASATYNVEENHSTVAVIRYFIQGEGVEAFQDKDDDWVIYVRNTKKGRNTIHVTCNAGDHGDSKEYTLKNNIVKIHLDINEDDGVGTLHFE